MERIKVAMCGSCITRVSFNSQFNPNYKKFYNLVSAFEQLSIISIMEPPIHKKELFNLSLVNNKTKQQIDNYEYAKEKIIPDFKKNVLSELKNVNPDYLILDNFWDGAKGIIKYNSLILSNNNFYEISKLCEKEYEVISLNTSPKKFLELYEKSFNNFYEFLKTNLPNTKIILNKGRAVSKIQKINGEITEHPPFEALSEMINKNMNILDSFIENNYSDILIIEQDFSEYASEEGHFFNTHPVHYNNTYYRDFLDELNYVIFNDKSIKMENKINRITKSRLCQFVYLIHKLKRKTLK
ncbi:MAG: DUF6270 domain-containing protein [Methanobacteriaceae archaeon]